MSGGNGTERENRPGAFRPEAPVRTNTFTPTALVVHPDHVTPRRLPARNRDTCHVMHTGEPSRAAAGWPAIAAGLQRARIRAHAYVRVLGGCGNAGNSTTQGGTYAAPRARTALRAHPRGRTVDWDQKTHPGTQKKQRKQNILDRRVRMWHRRCGFAGVSRCTRGVGTVG